MLGGLINLSSERMFSIKLIGQILRFGIKYWTTTTIIYGLALRSSVALRYKSLFDLNLFIRSLTFICFFLSINIIFMNYFGILYITIWSLNFLIWFSPRYKFTKLLYWTWSELLPNVSLGLLIGKINFLKYFTVYFIKNVTPFHKKCHSVSQKMSLYFTKNVTPFHKKCHSIS